MTDEKVLELEGVDLLTAIDLANVVREVGGFDTVDSLLPGKVSDSHNCVLANTFNCNVKISGIDMELKPEPDTEEFPWFAYFREKKYAEALARELGFEVQEYRKDMLLTDTLKDIQYAVQLPKGVGNIAKLFDDNALPEEYYL